MRRTVPLSRQMTLTGLNYEQVDKRKCSRRQIDARSRHPLITLMGCVKGEEKGSEQLTYTYVL